ncbi:uncharacterized protein LOC143353803 [Halictus rubicundus]|uniref:uncharacterized protein LOC143353803 n=1 Tax=Halictus rubicundus TaxID=77578 RepID=UPI004035D63D
MAVVPIRGNSNPSYSSVHIWDFEAINAQRELVDNWKPKHEVWWLKHGEKFVGGMCAVNGLLINSMFRNKLKLHSKGRFLSFVYASFGTGTLGGYFYSSFITNDILLYKHGCPVCYEIKASLITAATATLFPLLTMPLLNLGMAASVGLRVPFVYEVRELARFGWSVLKPGMTHLSFLCAFNSFTASVIAYKQMLAAGRIADTLLEMEDDLSQKKSETLQ